MSNYIRFNDFRQGERAVDCPLQVNSGCKVDPSIIESPVFFPKSDWRNLNEHEKKAFYQKAPITKCVSLFSVDPYIPELFWGKIEPLLLSTDDKVRAKVLANYSKEVIRRLDSFSSLKNVETYAYELAFNKPFQVSTGYNHTTKRFVGLHIDTHEVNKTNQRSEGFLLCGINLGRSYRYFYFVNIEVMDILQRLRDNTEDQMQDFNDVRLLKNAFLTRFPGCPIYRLRIEPGEAYLAVSQNMIHDGGTNEEGNIDVAFLLGGHFQIKSS
jgi:hypothetical protein